MIFHLFLNTKKFFAGKMTNEQKILVLEHFRRAGSLEYTASVLRCLHGDIGCEIERLEHSCGENAHLKILWELQRL